jgi:sulfur-carrier protein
MTRVRLPSPLQPLAGGRGSVLAEGATLRALINDLDRQYPGLRERMIDGGAVRGDIMIAIAGDEVRDLDAPVPPESEVHILPAIAGG